MPPPSRRARRPDGTRSRPRRSRPRRHGPRPASRPSAQPRDVATTTLTSKINPHGGADDLLFQYGTTTAYGSRTPSAGVEPAPRRWSDRCHRRARTQHEVPLPPRRAQQRRHHDRRRPGLRHAQAAARARAGRNAQPGRLRRPLDARRHAVGHRQRRTPDPAAAEALPVHHSLRQRRRPAARRTHRARSRSRCSRCR